MHRILIVGATGVLGAAATSYFLTHGFPVVCFARNKNKAAALQRSGAQLVAGDMTDKAALQRACIEADVVITAVHAMLGKGKNSSLNIDNKAHKALVDAAVKAKVTHFIYTSVHGVSPQHPIDFMRHKYAVEQYLVNSGLHYTILRLPAFMEWHVHNLLGKEVMEKNKVTILGKGENPTNFIAVDDVAQALGVIAGNSAYYDKIIPIAGPQNSTRNEIAAVYASMLNQSPKVSHVPVGALRILAKLLRPFHPGIARVMQFSAHTDTSDETMNTDDAIQQFGLPPTTVDAFIKSKVLSA